MRQTYGNAPSRVRRSRLVWMVLSSLVAVLLGLLLLVE